MAHKFNHDHDADCSQHVVLASDAFPEYFPQNTSGIFTNQINSPISNDRYSPLEVGVSQIGFSPELKKTKNIFATAEDAKIQVDRHLEENLLVRKKHQTQAAMVFTTSANILLKKFDKKLLLVVHITEKTKTLIIASKNICERLTVERNRTDCRKKRLVWKHDNH